MTTTTTTSTTTTLSVPSDQLIAGLKFVTKALPPPKDHVMGLNVVWMTSGPVWKGWDRDWQPQWGGNGITLACTDRFRLHVVGIELSPNTTDGTVPDFGTVSLDSLGALKALVAAPKPTKYSGVMDAAFKLLTPSTATLEWPFGASVPIELTGRDMPSIKPLLTLKDGNVNETTGFTPKYLSDALMAFHQVKGGSPVRMRTSRENKPVAVASADLEDSRSVIVMPVRLP